MQLKVRENPFVGQTSVKIIICKSEAQNLRVMGCASLFYPVCQRRLRDKMLR